MPTLFRCLKISSTVIKSSNVCSVKAILFWANPIISKSFFLMRFSTALRSLSISTFLVRRASRTLSNCRRRSSRLQYRPRYTDCVSSSVVRPRRSSASFCARSRKSLCFAGLSFLLINIRLPSLFRRTLHSTFISGFSFDDWWPFWFDPRSSLDDLNDLLESTPSLDLSFFLLCSLLSLPSDLSLLRDGAGLLSKFLDDLWALWVLFLCSCPELWFSSDDVLFPDLRELSFVLRSRFSRSPERCECSSELFSRGLSLRPSSLALLAHAVKWRICFPNSSICALCCSFSSLKTRSSPPSCSESFFVLSSVRPKPLSFSSSLDLSPMTVSAWSSSSSWITPIG